MREVMWKKPSFPVTFPHADRKLTQAQPFRPRFLYAGYKKTAWNQAVCGGVKWARTIDLYDVNVTL